MSSVHSPAFSRNRPPALEDARRFPKHVDIVGRHLTLRPIEIQPDATKPMVIGRSSGVVGEAPWQSIDLISRDNINRLRVNWMKFSSLLAALLATPFALAASLQQSQASGTWDGNNTVSGACTGVQDIPHPGGSGTGITVALIMHACEFPSIGPDICGISSNSPRLAYCTNRVGVLGESGTSASYSCNTIGDGQTDQKLCEPIPKTANCPLRLANPVELINGKKIQTTVDWESAEPRTFRFARHHSSIDHLFTDGARFAAKSRTGRGWRTDFDSSAAYDLKSGAVRPELAATNDLVHVVMPSSEQFSFRKSSAGSWSMVYPVGGATPGTNTWASRANYNGSLSVSASGVSFRASDGTRYEYDNSGLLQQITQPDGYAQYFQYTGNLNTSVTDSLGRAMRFEYETDANKPALLKVAYLPDGRVLKFTYVSRLIPPPASILHFCPPRSTSMRLQPLSILMTHQRPTQTTPSSLTST